MTHARKIDREWCTGLTHFIRALRHRLVHGLPAVCRLLAAGRLLTYFLLCATWMGSFNPVDTYSYSARIDYNARLWQPYHPYQPPLTLRPPSVS